MSIGRGVYVYVCVCLCAVEMAKFMYDLRIEHNSLPKHCEIFIREL